MLNGASHRDWIAADHYCQSIGAELLEVNSDDEQFILTTHFKDWNKAGVTRLWLGLRCHPDYADGKAAWKSQLGCWLVECRKFSDYGNDPFF